MLKRRRIPCQGCGALKMIGILRCAARFRAALFRMTNGEKEATVIVANRPLLAAEGSLGCWVSQTPRTEPALSEVEGSVRATRFLLFFG